MRREIELITQEELERLRGYQGIERDFDAYEKLDAGTLAMLCCLKDKSVDLFTRRYMAAKLSLNCWKSGISASSLGDVST